VDKSREDFEGWAEEAGALPWGYLKRQRNPSGGYSIQIYTYMWKAWQASRKALVVNIDSHTEFEIEHIASPKEDGYAKGWIDGRNYSVKQVVSAGITVKGEGDEQTNVLSSE